MRVNWQDSWYRIKDVKCTETKMSLFWQSFSNRLYRKSSSWQPPLEPVATISSKWQHFRLSIIMLKLKEKTQDKQKCFRLFTNIISNTIWKQVSNGRFSSRFWTTYFQWILTSLLTPLSIYKLWLNFLMKAANSKPWQGKHPRHVLDIVHGIICDLLTQIKHVAR